MILIVDDDAGVRDMVANFLQREGYAVTATETAAEALAAAECEPDLVISDVMMPETDGFQFMQAYGRRYPHRLTPFIFLSSLSDHYTIVLGLDIGADDFISKPVHLDILKAKVRAVLQRKNRYTSPAFYGDLSRYSFIKLLQFCERKAFTGEIVVTSSELHTRLQVRGGELNLDEREESTALLARLCELTEGTFVLHSQPVDFKEIEKAAVTTTPLAGAPEKVAGKLSAIRLEQRHFQVQTEMMSGQRDRLVTIVILDGKIILKRESLPQPRASKGDLEKLIETQHGAVEAEVRERISPDYVKRMKTRESQAERFNALFDEGCNRYRETDYAAALRAWEEALALGVEDKTLSINIRVARMKLAAASSG